MRARLADPYTHFLITILKSGIMNCLKIRIIYNRNDIAGITISPACHHQNVTQTLFNTYFTTKRLSFLALRIQPSGRTTLTLCQRLNFRPIKQHQSFCASPARSTLLLAGAFGGRRPSKWGRERALWVETKSWNSSHHYTRHHKKLHHRQTMQSICKL